MRANERFNFFISYANCADLPFFSLLKGKSLRLTGLFVNCDLSLRVQAFFMVEGIDPASTEKRCDLLGRIFGNIHGFRLSDD
jgi:hypothetical protein